MSDRARRIDTRSRSFSPRVFRRFSLAAVPLLAFSWWHVSGGASSLRTSSAEGGPPDLVLEWTEGGRPSASGSVVRGQAGETVQLSYQIRNVGGSDAYAAVVSAHTGLGRYGQPRHLQPGPAAGGVLKRRFSLTLALGMRELCLEAHLQTLTADEAKDPRPQDNRRCRKVELVEPSAAVLPALRPGID